MYAFRDFNGMLKVAELSIPTVLSLYDLQCIAYPKHIYR